MAQDRLVFERYWVVSGNNVVPIEGLIERGVNQ